MVHPLIGFCLRSCGLLWQIQLCTFSSAVSRQQMLQDLANEGKRKTRKWLWSTNKTETRGQLDVVCASSSIDCTSIVGCGTVAFVLVPINRFLPPFLEACAIHQRQRAKAFRLTHVLEACVSHSYEQQNKQHSWRENPLLATKEKMADPGRRKVQTNVKNSPRRTRSQKRFVRPHCL